MSALLLATLFSAVVAIISALRGNLFLACTAGLLSIGMPLGARLFIADILERLTNGHPSASQQAMIEEAKDELYVHLWISGACAIFALLCAFLYDRRRKRQTQGQDQAQPIDTSDPKNLFN